MRLRRSRATTESESRGCPLASWRQLQRRLQRPILGNLQQLAAGEGAHVVRRTLQDLRRQRGERNVRVLTVRPAILDSIQIHAALRWGFIYMTPAEPFCACAPASSPSSSGRGQGRPVLGQRSGLVSWAASCGQFLVGDPALGRGSDQAVQPLEGMALHVALVQSEGELVDVAAKVLVAGVVVDAVQSALEDRPHGFNAVRMDAIADVLACAVVDRLAPEEQATQATVASVFVAVDHAAGLDVRVDRPVQVGRINVLDRHGDGATAALTHSEDGGLSHSAAPLLEPLAGVFRGLFAADVSFVHFDDSGEALEVRAASLAQPPEDEPRGLLRDADFLGELQAADALARRDEQVHGVEPLVQWNVAALHDRAGANSEVLRALVAAVVAVLARRDPVQTSADRATRTGGPQPRLKVDAGRLVVREHLEQLECADGGVVVHSAPRRVAVEGVAAHAASAALGASDRPFVGKRSDTGCFGQNLRLWNAAFPLPRFGQASNAPTGVRPHALEAAANLFDGLLGLVLVQNCNDFSAGELAHRELPCIAGDTQFAEANVGKFDLPLGFVGEFGVRVFRDGDEHGYTQYSKPASILCRSAPVQAERSASFMLKKSHFRSGIVGRFSSTVLSPHCMVRKFSADCPVARMALTISGIIFSPKWLAYNCIIGTNRQGSKVLF